MKITRAKNLKRIMRFYRMTFDMTPPYNVVVDGTFIQEALKHKLHIKDQIPKMLGGRCKIMVTQCINNELKNLGEACSGARLIAKNFGRVACSHSGIRSMAIGGNSRQHGYYSARICILEVIGDGNASKLCVATQDKEIIHQLRRVPGVPLIRMEGNVPVLEDPGTASKRFHAELEDTKLGSSGWEKAYINVRKPEEEKLPLRPKRRKRNPNPLSCLKKKKRTATKG